MTKMFGAGLLALSLLCVESYAQDPVPPPEVAEELVKTPEAATEVPPVAEVPKVVEEAPAAPVVAGADQFSKVFMSYQVYLTAFVCVAGMTFTKKAVKILGKEKGSRILQNPWIGILLSAGNIPMGALFGLIPSFLPGSSLPERLMIGAVSGFMSNTIYGVAKRFFPDSMESTDTVKGIVQRKG